MSMIARPSILFVCPDNAGLSLMAEAIAIHCHPGVRAFSAGMRASGQVDIAAMECLHLERIPADGLSSKPLELFGLTGAPRIDVAVALVEGVHQAVRHLLVGRLVRLVRWGMEDVSRHGDVHHRRRAYRDILPALKVAIEALVAEEAGRCATAA